jgi:ABC-type transporter Mla subunit MlaD
LKLQFLLFGLMLCLLGTGRAVLAQDTEGPLSEAEVEAIRESAYIPMERLQAFEKILDSREKTIEGLIAKSNRPGYAASMHDALDQFGKIADELNDNLDELGRGHRDVRKELPKLIKATERWASALRNPTENDGYNIVKKLALDTVKDMHDLAVQMLTDEDAYFKAHPEAAAEEKAKVTRRE